MISLPDLWLPIVVSTVVAWVASMLIHMFLKYHDKDYQALANEDDVARVIRDGKPQKGVHTIPHCTDMKLLADPAMQKKFNDGPVAIVTVMQSGLPPMPKLVAQQISFFVLGMTLIAFVAAQALAPGASDIAIFRLVAVVGFLTYGWGLLPFSIWYGHPWAVSARFLLDALIYGVLTAGVFVWLWPGG